MKKSGRSPRYLAALAIAAGLILVLGNLFKPERRSDEGAAPPPQSETARAQLQRLSQRRALDNEADYLAGLAAGLAPYVFRLDAGDRSGLVWRADRLVSASGRGRLAEQDEAIGRNTTRLPAQTLIAGPHLPAAVWAIPAGRALPPLERFAAGHYVLGDWAVAVWRDQGEQLSWRAGQFLGTEQIACGGIAGTSVHLNLELGPEMAGGGVFDLDGGLMGLIVPCGQSFRVLGVTAIESIFELEGDFQSRLLRRYGLRATPMEPAEHERLEVEYGFLVREVWRGYQGYQAGLRPGDVVVSIDGTPVTSDHDIDPLLLPVARETFDLETVRFGRKRSIRLKARATVDPHYGVGGFGWAQQVDGLLIGPVSRDGPAWNAGARQGDRLLSINGVDQTDSNKAETALEALSGRSWAVFARGDRLWGRLLTP